MKKPSEIALRADRISQGLCRDCGRPRMVESKTYCAEHHAINLLARQKRSLEQICADCGGGAAPGLSKCRACLDKNNERTKKYHRGHREEVLSHYGGRCACCGEDSIEFLTIDHVNNDGAAHRREIAPGNKICLWLQRNGYPSGFQILCWNCNAAKYFHGGCPKHEPRRHTNAHALVDQHGPADD